MCLMKFYVYAAGRESQLFCNNIIDDIKGLDWRLSLAERNGFSDSVNNADVVIIVANLTSYTEIKHVESMLEMTRKFDVLTLVYSMKRLCKANLQYGVLAIHQRIIKETVVIEFDDDLPENNMIINHVLIKNNINKGLEHLSVQLILSIKAITEPMIKQELIGVDIADYRWAFEHKGLYQTKLFTKEALDKALVNRDHWLKAKVIVATIYLHQYKAIDIFSTTSETICNMLRGNNAALLIAPVIGEHVQDDPIISMMYTL